MTGDAGLAPRCDHQVGCITCGDAAASLRVVGVDDDSGLALCADEHGSRETVQTELVGPVAIGDVLLVHAGTAISTLDRGGAG